MKIYLVGGAIRDRLLGLPIKERDWVVVGATEDDMLTQGYQRVGKEFPVFLHPKTREEYALARMERKTKPGYAGFSFDVSPKVTLEEDLLRRDLTINAMAETEDGTLIDPYHGQDDLDKKILRHVSDAFVEDPVRILRIGRFLARYSHLGFTVAMETIQLMQKMVIAGEVDALVAERVWKELERSLTEKNPEMFFNVISRCGALETLFPGIAMKGKGMKALIAAGELTHNSAIRFAALLHEEDAKNLAQICNRYRVPNAHQQLAKLITTYHADALDAKNLSADKLLDLFSRLDIFRREERFDGFLTACTAIAKINSGSKFDASWLRDCAQAAKSYPVQELLNQGVDGVELATKLRSKRQESVAKWLKSH